jgi:hypothetical protein
MSSSPRLPGVRPDAPPDFADVMSHAPETLARFGALYATFWQAGTVDARLKEITRIRNARVTDCGF